jgi:hypothetical protein
VDVKVEEKAEEEVDVKKQLSQLTARAESDAADDAVTPALAGCIGTGFQHSSAPRRKTLTASALTKPGIVGVLRRVSHWAHSSKAPSFVRA